MQNCAPSERIHTNIREYDCDGFRTLRLDGRVLRRLRRALSQARRLSASDDDAAEALRRLAADARLIEAGLPGGPLRRLPARRGRIRLADILGTLLQGGDTALTVEKLMDALRRPSLTLRELWSADAALRIAVAEALAQVAEAVVRGAADCAAAEKWLDHPGRLYRRPSPDFIERALKRCGEENLCVPRKRLEARLQSAGMSAEAAIRQAHDARAHHLMRLENLMDALRLTGRLDWQACFEALSETDAELRRDPAGVYPRMDEASRRLALAQVEAIARAAAMDERAVARHAVAAARQRRGCDRAAPTSLAALEDVRPGESCCWWLCDDAGRAALLRRMGRRARLPRRVPDPRGIGCIAVSLASTGVITSLLWRWLPARWLAFACLPAAWSASNAAIHRIFPLFFHPLPLLKLKIDRLPDIWRTLVATPVLLTDVDRADAACDNLEALGCLEDDPNLAFALLGDFADADRAAMPGDDAIVSHTRARIAEMNRRAGREKYFYLHRPRTLLKPDMRYMGRDRKRGALMDLNRVLLGGESDFSVEGAACAALRGRYAFVVTLDADTRMLPGDVHRLAGALAHPMNRRYAVLQPRMEVAPSSVASRFQLLYSGVGGLDAYPTRFSSFWMDLTGAGLYGGKGIYRVADFQRAVEGALPEGRVLSHDLIEGALAGAGFLDDVALYDGCPATLSGWMDRQHRWTRGDWQLLPMIFSKKTPLRAADRYRMLDNLMRSLRAPALWLMLMVSVWTGRPEGVAAALPLVFLNALLHPLRADNWRRGLIELVTLPLAAHRSADAALRALWRVFVSGRRLLSWVPSADADRGPASNISGRVSALMALPGLMRPGGIAMTAALFMLFWVGVDWVRDMESQPVSEKEALTAAQRAALRSLAAETWRFFADAVPPDGPALPPDNVQLDPPAGAARRTSPTNVALYLLSCVSAMKLGLLERESCLARVSRALDAVDAAEKWRGHLYNWIDIDTLSALRPRYVSAVDSGNLAACALACAALIGDDALAARLRALAEGMDLAALYDRERALFRIGIDVDADAPSASHYDLLASESRILSYVALMLGQVPLKHWYRLGRSCARVGDGAALLSWSGTMFEYLMPELLMRAPALSLLGESARRAVRAQIAHSAPWGVSESGYHAFDAQMNYQYRAFGLKALSMSGDVPEDAGVIAPYASALALCALPSSAAENLERMSRLGWRDRHGFFEAADSARPGADGAPALVKSHMAHHQGMVLCAICNALCGDWLARGFMRDPRARALSLLLEERPACKSHIKPLPKAADVRPARALTQRVARGALDAHLLAGRDAWALVTADGAVHYARGGFDATRFYGELADRPDAARLRLRVDGMPCAPRLTCRYDAGSARFEGAARGLSIAMTVTLSPEDDALYRSVKIENNNPVPARVEILDAFAVSLARPRDFRAHPAFQLLFVESEYYGDSGLMFRRRARNPGESCPALIHNAFARGRVARESRYENAFDRRGDAQYDLKGGVGTVLNPASALRVDMTLAPGGSESACFALRLCMPGEDAALRCLPERAGALNRARTEAMLGFLGISPALYHRLDRLAALLMDPGLAAKAKACRAPAPGAPVEALWALGISGDRPILSATVSSSGQLATAQALVRAQRFYRAMGLETDLALVDASPESYDKPVRDALRGMLDAAALREGEGAYLLTGLTSIQVDAVRRASTIALDAGRDFAAQVRQLLDALEPGATHPAFNPGASLLPPPKRAMDNGFGGFTPDGYEIDVLPARDTPAPWCDILSTGGMGILLTERGGGFAWHANSRFCRLTGYRGDPARERFGLSVTFIADSGEALPLLPGARPAMPFRVTYAPDEVRYAFSTARATGSVTFGISDCAVLIAVALDLKRCAGRVAVGADWLMGAERCDAVRVRVWQADGSAFATGAAEGVGWLACDSIDAECASGLSAPVTAGENRMRFALGWARDIPSARRLARSVRDGAPPEACREDNGALHIDTPDAALNRMMNAFLPHQVRAARVDGRTGYYQPGGAYGFRDQLQDMLALIPLEPDRVRGHLLLCAGRQFAAGDALHWWHSPYLGVRTRIRDDRLFLCWVAAEYVRQTGDAAVLQEVVPYLEDAPIPEDREDLFCAMAPGSASGTLHEHCMRAFRSCDATGAHGLALMGSGDWNDGMNRVGSRGRGESVWLSEFIAACADRYADICPSEADAAWLRALSRRHRGAVELYGWDGRWYLRAYTDEGVALGGADSPACRIDMISQAWAVLSGLSPDRCRMAVDAAWRMLVDEKNGILRLLTPPFGAEGVDPGYIRGYPAGVRENGAQYTHAACWLMLALVALGDANRAHRALQMLLPPNRADTPEKARRYRVEPYVTSADVYDLPGDAGRGGWSWYTGSAAWLYVAALGLMGYERRANRVRLNALLGPWPQVSVEVRFESSRYRLTCGKDVRQTTLDGRPVGEDFIEMTDDGRNHEALFPPRTA